MHDFEKCIGIELLDNLFNKSVDLKTVYDNAYSNKVFNPEKKPMPSFEVY